MTREQDETRARLIERIQQYFAWCESPEFEPCPRCNGKGSHHGFGENGADPDWCEKCGGPGEQPTEPGTWSPDDLLREAADLLGSVPLGQPPPLSELVTCSLRDPDHVVHRPRLDCQHEAPHLIAACGAFADRGSVPLSPPTTTDKQNGDRPEEWRRGYGFGHKDARHAAAELAGEALASVSPPPHKERVMPIIDKHRTGLYRKFEVRRTDGTDQPGGKHDGCNYFVLDLTHDPHALPALRAYAESCRADYPALARDLYAVSPPPSQETSA